MRVDFGSALAGVLLLLGGAFFVLVALIYRALERAFPGQSWWKILGAFLVVLFVLTVLGVRHRTHTP